MSGSYTIVVDGGGTKTAVMLHCDKDGRGVFFKGVSGPSNIFSLSDSVVIEAIKSAVRNALTARNNHLEDSSLSQQLEDITVADAHIGLAGALSSKESDIERVKLLLKQEIKAANLSIVSDLFLIPKALPKDENRRYCIALIAGTGSSSLLFKCVSSDFELVARSGGWGPLFGDDGAGYSIGRQAIRSTLSALDIYAMHEKLNKSPSLKSVHQRVYDSITKGAELISLTTFLSALNQSTKDEADKRRAVASLSAVVFDELSASDGSELIVQDILQGEIEALVKLVIPFLEVVNAQETTLVVSGTLLSLKPYFSLLCDQLNHHKINFKSIETVFDPALEALKRLTNG